MTPSELTDRLKAEYAAVRENAFSGGEFRRRIEDQIRHLERQGARIRVHVRQAGQEIASYGPDADADWDTLKVGTEDLGGVEGVFEFSVARNASPADRERTSDLIDAAFPGFVDLVRAFWEGRNELSLVLDRQKQDHERRVERTVRQVCGDGRPVCLAHIDLDGLKRINNERNYDEGGTKAIRAFSARLRRDFDDEALIMVKGGDEFLVIWCDRPLFKVLLRLDGFRRLLATEPLNPEWPPNTCTIAVAAHPENVATPTGKGWFKTLLDAAMPVEKVNKDHTGRNLITLPSAHARSGGTADVPIQVPDLEAAALIARHNIHPQLPPPFGDGLDQFLALRLEEAFTGPPTGELGDLLREVLRAAGCTITAHAPTNMYGPRKASPEIHPLGCTAIVLHALLRAAFRRGGPLKPDDRLQLLVVSATDGRESLAVRVSKAAAMGADLTIEIGSVSGGAADLVVDAGRPWYPQDEAPVEGLPRFVVKGEGPAYSLSPILLVRIGDQPGVTEVEPWADCIPVDPRPVTQGGLPDFWQSNLSRIVEATLRNPNIAHVLLVGDAAHAARTLELVRKQDEWVPETLTKQLGVDARAIGQFRARQITASVVDRDRAAIYSACARWYFTEEKALPRALRLAGEPRDLRLEREKRRPLRTVLSQPHPTLGLEDGLAAPTFAEAYPLAIAALRAVAGGDEYTDQTGRTFREFSSYKIVLTEPAGGQLPTFWETEQARLDQYVEEVFRTESGTFGRRLRHWGQGTRRASGEPLNVDQVELAAKATSETIRAGFESRRIALFLAEPGEENGPLGLVSAHVFPRRRGGVWYLDFHWVWRTVEALVGLAYSGYGSIKQSEDFLGRVNRAISSGGAATAKVGKVIYTALSLHLFLDRGDLEVARTIVVEASD